MLSCLPIDDSPRPCLLLAAAALAVSSLASCTSYAAPTYYPEKNQRIVERRTSSHPRVDTPVKPDEAVVDTSLELPMPILPPRSQAAAPTTAWRASIEDLRRDPRIKPLGDPPGTRALIELLGDPDRMVVETALARLEAKGPGAVAAILETASVSEQALRPEACRALFDLTLLHPAEFAPYYPLLSRAFLRTASHGAFDSIRAREDFEAYVADAFSAWRLSPFPAEATAWMKPGTRRVTNAVFRALWANGTGADAAAVLNVAEDPGCHGDARQLIYFLLEKWSETSVDADPYAATEAVARAVREWRAVFGLADAGDDVKPVGAMQLPADDK